MNETLFGFDVVVLAAWLVIGLGFSIILNLLLTTVAEILLAIRSWRARRKRWADHEKWANARREAGDTHRQRMRDEGYWDNYELQDIVNAAGERAVPGFRP
jgi:hypothetical protein